MISFRNEKSHISLTISHHGKTPQPSRQRQLQGSWGSGPWNRCQKGLDVTSVTTPGPSPPTPPCHVTGVTPYCPGTGKRRMGSVLGGAPAPPRPPHLRGGLPPSHTSHSSFRSAETVHALSICALGVLDSFGKLASDQEQSPRTTSTMVQRWRTSINYYLAVN